MINKLLYLFLLTSTMYCAQDCSKSFQYALGDRFYIKIPDCLEYQDGIMKKNMDYYHQQMGSDYDDKAVFQRKGMNDSYLSSKQSSYEKVMYEMKLSKIGKFKKLGSAFTSSEITLYSNEILQALKSINSVVLLKWDKPDNVKIGNIWAMKVSYERKFLGNEIVRNSSYYIQDSDRIHIISLSYKVKEEDIWKPIMAKTIMSLNTNN